MLRNRCTPANFNEPRVDKLDNIITKHFDQSLSLYAEAPVFQSISKGSQASNRYDRWLKHTLLASNADKFPWATVANLPVAAGAFP